MTESLCPAPLDDAPQKCSPNLCPGSAPQQLVKSASLSTGSGPPGQLLQNATSAPLASGASVTHRDHGIYLPLNAFAPCRFAHFAL